MARQKNLAREWTPTQVEEVFHSIYFKQHPTLESWRASQRSADGVVGLVLWRMPLDFMHPTAPPLNARMAQAASSTVTARNVAERRILAARVLLSCARGWLAVRRVRARRAAFKLYHHIARVQGRTLRVCNAQGLFSPLLTRCAALRVHLAVLCIQGVTRRRLYDVPARCIQRFARGARARRHARLEAVSRGAALARRKGVSLLVRGLLDEFGYTPSPPRASFLSGGGMVDRRRLYWLGLVGRHWWPSAPAHLDAVLPGNWLDTRRHFWMRSIVLSIADGAVDRACSTSASVRVGQVCRATLPCIEEVSEASEQGDAPLS